jgi:hypothetical protein
VAAHLLADLVDHDRPEVTVLRFTCLAEELGGLAAQFADLADATAGAGTMDAWLEQVPR